MKKQLMILTIVAMIALSGCGKNTNTNQPVNDNQGVDHSQMDHSSNSELPKGLKEAKNPTFKVGSTAIIKANHMTGMDGADATIVGAYTTTAYSVSYTPTTGGKKESNHKWVIHEEIKDAINKPYEVGAEVVLQAEHMMGMNGATATIDSAEQTTVYMFDYKPTTGGELMKNHMWVTESELTSK